jgi:SHS2 domain-containing protein
MDAPDAPHPGREGFPQYRVIPHTADTGIEAYGESREALIANAAAGMFGLMYGASAAPDPDRQVVFTIGSSTDEDLLVDVLAELLYLSEAEDVAFSRFDVARAEGRAVQVTARGHPSAGIDLSGPPVKAVTYHGLEVEHGDGWRARIIFDV